jgi:arginyl-tRNA synthetase
LYRYLELRLIEYLRDFLLRTYGVEAANIVVEQPPKIELGEYALPLAFELAKKLRKAPERSRKRLLPASVRFRALTDLRSRVADTSMFASSAPSSLRR